MHFRGKLILSTFAEVDTNDSHGEGGGGQGGEFVTAFESQAIQRGMVLKARMPKADVLAAAYKEVGEASRAANDRIGWSVEVLVLRKSPPQHHSSSSYSSSSSGGGAKKKQASRSV